ncbi:MAG: type III pantothenate kinase [Bacillota bacterium]|nr:type III pantothenate kinase [Bacillota bacterium]
MPTQGGGMEIFMLLAVDIGNTHIVLGGFEGEKLRFVSRISTNAHKTSDEYASKLQAVLELHGATEEAITGAIISSVVPPLTSIMKDAISLVYNVDSFIVGPGIKTGLNLLVDNPAAVGSDLICACVGTKEFYSYPSVIIDMGTATKMMILDKNGAFIGVTISPGAEIAIKALAGGTAQLPQIDLTAPAVLLGKNTIECMRSGVIFGNACMVDGMIDRLEAELGTPLDKIATGGLSNVIIPHCTHDIIMDDNLVLKGLRVIYLKNCK